MRAFGTHGSAVAQFNMPGGVAVATDEQGEEMVIVTDQGNGRLQSFTLDGRFLREVGKQGTGDGEPDADDPIVGLGGDAYVASWNSSLPWATLRVAEDRGHYIVESLLEDENSAILAALEGST